jgi:hypothetical protein
MRLTSGSGRLASRLHQRLDAVTIEAFPGGKGFGGTSSEYNFAELLLGALRVPDVAHGFRPALLSRLAQAARGRFARLDSPLRELRFHGFSRMLRMAAREPACLCVCAP